MQTLKPLIMSAMLLGAPLALHAQATTATENPQAGANAFRIGTQPVSVKASNIAPADTHSVIAPSAPPLHTPPGAPVHTLLAAANRAIASGQTNMADEALENAETQLLQASVPATDTDYTSHDPIVAQISQARQALGNNDNAGATQIINAILASGAPELNE